MKNIGFSDTPLRPGDKNEFKTEAYIDSLTKFILTCSTPMTIAIQGDWGTGKTSMMNLMIGVLNPTCKCIYFNTWQYAQFNLDDKLAALMLNHLAKALGKTYSFNDIKTKGRDIVNSFLNNKIGPDLNLLDFDAIEELVNIKEKFQEAINENALESSAKRVVIFVDDLDRLNPQKAVELLEVMKLFLDCEKCVFVLAIDYDVVIQGIQIKYGNMLNEDRGKYFFDKIIQLPFKMPVIGYNIENYFNNLMKCVWESDSSAPMDIPDYLSIVELTVGKNPRRIKRIVNSFIVINDVANNLNSYQGDKPKVKYAKQKILFSILCIQLAWDELYGYILSHAQDPSKSIIDYFSSIATQENSLSLIKAIYPKQDDSALIERMQKSLVLLFQCIDSLASIIPERQRANAEITRILLFSSFTGNKDIPGGINMKKKELDVDEFYKLYGDYREMDWVKAYLERLCENSEYSLVAFTREKSSDYLRLLRNNIFILDIVPHKKVGIGVDFAFKSLEDQTEFKNFALGFQGRGIGSAVFWQECVTVTNITDEKIFDKLVRYTIERNS